MGGIFGVASKTELRAGSCFLELIIILIWEPEEAEWPCMIRRKVLDRAIHNIENSPFRTKFDKDVAELEGNLGIGCISDNEPQPLLVRSHLGKFCDHNSRQDQQYGRTDQRNASKTDVHISLK